MIVICALLFTLMIIPAFANENELRLAPINPAFQRYIDLIQLGKVPRMATAEGYHLGFTPGPLDMSHTRGLSVVGEVDRLAYSTTYDLRTLGYLTPVKDQESCGACWTFATYGSLESWLLRDKSQTWDFSENNMKNLHGFDWGPCAGGNRDMSIAYLARWSGPVNESDDPYNPLSGASPSGLQVRKHVQTSLWTPDQAGPTDTGNIKQAVMNYGAMYTSMYTNPAYYNSTNYTYYYSGAENGNHAVAIVGWDDNKSNTLFNTTPAGNGAWLVRNSWGSSWGDGGYFWISYYDTRVGSSNASFINAREPGTTMYQYDTLGNINNVGYGSNVAWGANIFTATSNENLSAVCFYAGTVSTSYEIYIYDTYSGGNFSGLLGSKTGTLTYPGYHTVYLDSSIPLTNGDDFAVVIKFTTPGYTTPIPIEQPIPGYSDAATASAGQSYISPNGTVWQDLTTAIANTNVCIKAIAGVTVPDFSFSTSSKKWRMFSVPVELNDSSPPSVLEDDLGGQDDTVWKVYRWETEANDYSKYPDIPDINPGIAFWIITKDSKNIDVGEGKSTDASSDYTIPLSYSVSLNQGWNQIGNPFAFNVNRDDVKVEKDGVTKSISAASDWVRNRIWWYSDSSSDYDHTKTVLESWEGYWIKALTEDCKLLIPPIVADGSLQALAKSEENYLQIIAKVGDLKDRYNFIGLSNKAKNSYDTEDVEEAPPISSYISLSFSHSDWGKDSGSYTQDIRKVPDKKKSSPEKITWDMQIDTDQLNKTITLEWKNTEGIPEEYYLYLTDRNENILTDIREKDTYSFTTSTGKDTFKIVATTKELSLSPEDLTLTEVYNYPNPANDTTNIHFKLGAEASVTIRMYTISGELVKTLVGNEAYAVGTYSEPWQLNNNEGEKVARGIYILLVKATNSAKTLIKTNKIAVIK